MCGIVGYSGSFAPGLLEQGNALQRHRGPDDAGVFVDGDSGVGFGHVRLSILDLSAAGHQPMTSADGNVVIVFNGEIYNFKELRADLMMRGHRFRGHSDTEVLLNLYIEKGASMLSELNGIFAFALWDRRVSALVVARDALGVKPLYYSESAKGVAFASEIKTLLSLVPEQRELDPSALHRYLSFLWCPGEGTPLRAVKKVLPGEMLVVRNGSIVEKEKWYRLPAFRSIEPNLTMRQSIEGTAEYLRKAVNRQMIADVPVGAFLSGGLDSSAIVAFAREQNADLQCFTIRNVGGQDAGFSDDLPYAKKVANHLNVDLHVVDVSAADVAADLQEMVRQLDEPLIDTAPLNVLYISRLARHHGMKVLLSGAAGDDLFTGYRRHLAIQYERVWNWLPKQFTSSIESLTSHLDQRKPFNRRLTKLFNGSSLSGDERIVNYFLWAKSSELHRLYSADFASRLTDDAVTKPMLDFLKPMPANVSALARMLSLEQRFFLPDFNLMFTDKMSMATGVEVRVPFLDLELVDFASRIPDRFKQNGAHGKWVLKKAMEAYLPKDVIYRPKTGFGGPLRRWMSNELKPLLHDLLDVDSVKRRGLFDPTAVQSLISRNESGAVDASYVLLSLMCIEIWCRSYLD